MYRVLVVDDEEWIRRGLVSKIRKSGLPISDVDQAPNAEAALQLMGQTLPDIILCDIRMEDMDGLELIRIVHYKHPHIKTIIISGYSEFDYAAEALKHEVKAYLLKPIDTDSLLDALRGCIQAIEDERAQSHRVGELLRRESVKRTRYQIHRLLRKGVKPDTIFPTYRHDDLFQAISLFIDARADVFDVDTMDEVINQHPIWQFQRNIVYYEHSDDEIILVVRIPRGEAAMEYERHVMELINHLAMELRSDGLHRYTFGVGDVHHELDTCIQQALLCMKHRLFLEDNQIVRLKDILPFQGAYKLSPQHAALLKRQVEARDLQGVARTLSELYSEVMAASVAYRSVQNLYNRLLMMASEEFDVDMERHRQLLPLEVYHFASLRQMFEAVRAVFVAIINALPTTKPSKHSVVQAIREYIDAHYAEDLRLEDIAAAQGYNASYLSALFKEGMGVNFQDYVQRVRIDHAKRLMASGQYKIKDIAQSTGFNDPHYFSQVFKKVEGVTPTEYLSQF